MEGNTPKASRALSSIYFFNTHNYIYVYKQKGQTKMINQDQLRERTKFMMKTLDYKVSCFARQIGFCRESYYKWINGTFDFGEEKAQKINEFLTRYGF